ncbi:hypothetical protein [Novosphingobium sp. MMS21-SN21R]|uniref:hypothetical protein n=1 Tax=Novosphingobium sp. MMS21-SN21R TaxID=2969298 RepID=UPI002885C935|nr:hypothetical protein [Novosphingobium sp. MMS21-SN21R]MDT0507507.1 hypothetical protein [Novosphingobium sp. MMS21-SN21R]
MDESLTNAERKTLNAAYDILNGKLNEGEYWTFGWRWYRGHAKPSTDVSMFTAVLEKHISWLEGETFADKIANGMAMNAAERAAAPSPEEAKRLRIQRLRDQLEREEAA